VVWLHGLAFDWYGGAIGLMYHARILCIWECNRDGWMTGLVSLIYSLYEAEGL
jgi:hypothetical protein